jgi:hypothetical protein
MIPDRANDLGKGKRASKRIGGGRSRLSLKKIKGQSRFAVFDFLPGAVVGAWFRQSNSQNDRE